MENYEQQSKDFLNKTNTTFKAEFLKNDYHFDSDTTKRDIYNITLERGNRKFSFKFGQSAFNSSYYLDRTTKKKFNECKDYYESLDSSKKMYKENFFRVITNSSMMIGNHSSRKQLINFGVLKTGVEPSSYDVLSCLTKYDPETFENFCSAFGYDEDSKKSEKTFNAVLDEYKNVAMLWNESEIEELQEIQ